MQYVLRGEIRVKTPKNEDSQLFLASKWFNNIGFFFHFNVHIYTYIYAMKLLFFYLIFMIFGVLIVTSRINGLGKRAWLGTAKSTSWDIIFPSVTNVMQLLSGWRKKGAARINKLKRTKPQEAAHTFHTYLIRSEGPWLIKPTIRIFLYVSVKWMQ